ncbi:uncharacterized protein LOC129590543 isoform X2 [Paramacrobiotus metropolitanus]|uniref:uncharacterized protein LOC129590543 isoform X2 n=1 Tax=Paramacrobiotus metropolitanus TaxID=2943436 RepID=UPI002445F74F|nr:uncharacterized protein LOC129590543 isoform X2 [Paramacrobiotus metropolitanus]
MQHASASRPYTDAPPDYGLVMRSPPTTTGLQAVDFLPRVTAVAGPCNRPVYESFNVLAERASVFLRNNPHWAVNTCESVEFPVYSKGYDIDAVESAFTVYGDSDNRYIRGLRLWMQHRSSCSATTITGAQQIGYLNFLPRINYDDSVERLDSVLQRINSKPVKGTIITVETQPVKWGSKDCDADRTAWTERSGTRERFLNLVRIFYIRGPAQRVQVGLKDFLPSSGDDYSHPHTQTFPAVMQRVREWMLSVPPNYRPVNVQTVAFRGSGNKFDTWAMTYREDKQHLNYMRYLRVAFIVEDPTTGPLSRSMIQLDSQLFTPRVLPSHGFCGVGAFESQDTCRQRLDAWVQATGARVVAVETLLMPMVSGGETVNDGDAMRICNNVHLPHSDSHTHNQRFVYMYRIYTDGIVPDQPVIIHDTQRHAYATPVHSGDLCTIS